MFGLRWLRDTRRHDIQGELSGWPAGPAFSLRPEAKNHHVRRVGLFGLRALYVAVGGALESGCDTAARQRAYVDSYVAAVAVRDTSVEPVITRRPSKRLLIEVTTTKPVKPEFGMLKPFWFMSPAGSRGAFDPNDLWQRSTGPHLLGPFRSLPKPSVPQ
ncbi:hypothetical protein ABZT03_04990 [Streptomyces sp. NPDC005574]|uniref:hypothetical protein n=1 Tax=Streptomyces sp. NPDC005574 TaxID=3156891 RepID=UPI0033A341BC